MEVRWLAQHRDMILAGWLRELDSTSTMYCRDHFLCFNKENNWTKKIGGRPLILVLRSMDHVDAIFASEHAEGLRSPAPRKLNPQYERVVCSHYFLFKQKQCLNNKTSGQSGSMVAEEWDGFDRSRPSRSQEMEFVHPQNIPRLNKNDVFNCVPWIPIRTGLAGPPVKSAFLDL